MLSQHTFTPRDVAYVYDLLPNHTDTLVINSGWRKKCPEHLHALFS